MFARLRVGHKIAVIIAIGIVMGLAVGVNSLLSYRSVLAKANELYEDRMVVVDNISSTIQHAQQVREAVLLHVLEPNIEKKREVYESRIKENDQAVGEMLAVLRRGQRTDAEVEVIRKLQLDWMTYHALHTETVMLDQQGDHSGALQAAFSGTSAQAFYNVRDTLNELKQVNMRLAVAARDGVVTQGRWTGWINTLMLIGGMIVLALSGTLVSRKITQPLIELTSSMQKAKSILAVQTTLAAGDEISQLINFCNQFTTMLKKKLAEVAELNTRHNLILQSIDEGICGVDVEGKTVFVNNAAATMLGYERQAMIGHPLTDLVLPANSEKAPCWTEDGYLYFTEGTAARWEGVFFRHNGKSMDVECISTPIVQDGKRTGAVIAFRDVSNRKRMAEEQARLMTIIEESPIFVSMADAEGWVQYCNRTAGMMLGVGNHKDLSGFNMTDIFPEQVHQLAARGEATTSGGAVVWSGESTILPLDGQQIPVLKTIVAHKNDRGATDYFSTVAVDISELKRYEAQLTFMATHDSVTGLLNRRGFLDKMAELASPMAPGKSPWTLLYLDLDNLKEVNDRFGHDAGDELLAKSAALLRASFPMATIIGRFGGDEFGVVLATADVTRAYELSQAYLDSLQHETIFRQAGDITPMASIGIASYPENGNSLADLIRKADLAMYAAKHAGGNQVAVYSTDLEC